jgi:large subunit ribosomal protein L21
MMQSVLRVSARGFGRRIAQGAPNGSTLIQWPPALASVSLRYLSTAPKEEGSGFAAVDHSYAYESSMQGLHGQQLANAALEGEGKDDPDFDPFIEEEREEERLKQLGGMEEAEYVDNTGDEDSEEDDDDGEEVNWKSVYNNDGSLRRKKSEFATLRAGAPAGGMVAIIELAGSQHKVTTDDVLIVNRLSPIDTFKVGSIHKLKDVMLVSSSHLTLVGQPYIAGAEVEVMVEEVTKDAKVIIFKRRRRKNYRKKNGFRRDVTMLRILDIRPPEAYADHAHVERPEPEL